MRTVFADTFFYLALLNEKDAAHHLAIDIGSKIEAKVVTTEWVLTEIADALSAPRQRALFNELLETLLLDSDVLIVESESSLFRAGCELFAKRPDKHWSLTDCISFVVMGQSGISEALTADHHFEQAGFVSLLLIR